ncbi:adenosine-diphosphatase, putative [Hepatocystis sp. ex Piliocolobus tephrosceles]|nr:adenosine-diphosphatase, putative [Hepatocystis sp. ex Piliocolobus tephrosceles]
MIYIIFIYFDIRTSCEVTKNLNTNEQLVIDNENNNVDDIYKSIIIDAGSTGTRVYIYNYTIINDNDDGNNSSNNKNIRVYIPSINSKTTPGLVYLLNNYFEENETKPFDDYFKEIKTFINKNVKPEERSSTTIFMRASGGFRLLSINKSEKYINFLKTYLLTNFNEFLLIDDLLINVLSGKEEAILSFVSIYALLEKFSPSPVIYTNKKEKKKGEEAKNVAYINEDNGIMNYKKDTIGVLELGGATAQIVIKIPPSEMNKDISNIFNYKYKEKNKVKSIIEENYKNRNIIKINLYNKDIYLYCKSYLVLGRQNIMKTYLHYNVHEYTKNGNISNEPNVSNISNISNISNKFVPLPCFPKNFKFYINNLYDTSIEEELQEYQENIAIDNNTYVGVGMGDLELCRKQIQNILNYAQIHALPFNLKKFIKLYGIENFHHFAIDILNISEEHNPIPLNTDMYLEKAKEVCPLTISEIKKIVRPESNMEKSQTSCFGLIFLYEFMRYIFNINNSIRFHSTNYINETNITWTISVLLMELPPHIDLIKKQKQKQKQRIINNNYDEL